MAKLEILPKRLDILDSNDNACQFRINIDVLNEAFGIGRSMFAKACYPDTKGGFFLGTKPGDKFFIWMPKLYGNSSDWKNVISEDGNEIYEVAENNRHEDWISEKTQDMVNNLRIVFVKPDSKSPYKFVGVFRLANKTQCNHTYERIATMIRVIGNPVTKIELLDDRR